jgi:hypothetical protein
VVGDPDTVYTATDIDNNFSVDLPDCPIITREVYDDTNLSIATVSSSALTVTPGGPAFEMEFHAVSGAP